MVEPVHLRNAPITEALLDIQVRLPGSPTYESLTPFVDAVADAYPQRLIRQEFQAEFGFSGNAEIPIAQSGHRQSTGYQLRSNDGIQVVQARINGFSFSRLKPYTRWEELRAEARRLWDVYCTIARPTAITRLGLRYINRVEIPLPIADFTEYLLTVPEIAPGLPQGLQHFFMHLVIPMPDEEVLVIINQTIDQQQHAPDILPLIFDIDVSRTQPLDPVAEGVWQAFDVLRTLKNDYFFKSITSRTVELCR